jgi:hypothetical protein
MKTIWKVPLKVTGEQNTIRLPRWSELLTVQTQRAETCVWALVSDTRGPLVDYVIDCFGTGASIEVSEGKYLGTTQYDYGNLVLHWFGYEVTQ